MYNKLNKYILQEFIEGEQFCSYSVIKNHNLSLYSDYKTIFSANGGATIAFQYAQNEKIKEFVQEFSKNENFEDSTIYENSFAKIPFSNIYQDNDFYCVFGNDLFSFIFVIEKRGENIILLSYSMNRFICIVMYVIENER